MMRDGAAWSTTYHAGRGPERPMEQRKTIIYYGPDQGDAAKALATAERKSGNYGFYRDAMAFNGDIERCNRVVIMDEVRDVDRKRIEDAYLGRTPLTRGSDKWDGAVIVASDAGDDSEDLARAEGRYHVFKQVRAQVDPRLANKVEKVREGEQIVQRPVKPIEAAEPKGSAEKGSAEKGSAEKGSAEKGSAEKGSWPTAEVREPQERADDLSKPVETVETARPAKPAKSAKRSRSSKGPTQRAARPE